MPEPTDNRQQGGQNFGDMGTSKQGEGERFNPGPEEQTTNNQGDEWSGLPGTEKNPSKESNQWEGEPLQKDNEDKPQNEDRTGNQGHTGKQWDGQTGTKESGWQNQDAKSGGQRQDAEAGKARNGPE